MRELSTGTFSPLGATLNDGWWNFAIYSPRTLEALVLAEYSSSKGTIEIPLSKKNRTGDIWHIAVKAYEENILWGWKIDHHIVPDPYARLLKTGHIWGNNKWKDLSQPISVAIKQSSKCVHRPYIPQDLIIYEAHVRGFTKSPSSKVTFPGTFLGMIEKLDHIKKLGATAIELLPIYEFDESEWKKRNPSSNSRLYNYWGYSPLSFFSPMQRYGTSDDPLQTADELKQLVQACHNMDIAVILDVVYNHTGEGSSSGPAYNLKLLAENTYYIKGKEFANFSGCGNTLNTNHPIVIDLIRESLRHWIQEYSIDGFRFDLASILTRNQSGISIHEPSCLNAIVQDPIISKSILIAEPWDASGLHQTGHFFSLNQEKKPLFKEWNDHFRNDVRRFIRGDRGYAGKFAVRICGSEDLYHKDGSPENTVNFITSHDGFTLYDLVGYRQKQNRANGEHNKDGTDENYSSHCGDEGKTERASIKSLRKRQMKNFLTALIFSQGCPMILMGDEYGQTHHGNNNAWCQDSPLNWLDWNSTESKMFEYISNLIGARKKSGCFARETFLKKEDIDWHGKHVFTPIWDDRSSLCVAVLKNKNYFPSLFFAFNAAVTSQTIEVPEGKWYCISNTGTASLEGKMIQEKHVHMKSYSSILCVPWIRES